MTSKERLRRCYFHEELDRPGVYFRTGYPSDDPTYEPVRAYVEANSDLKGAWSPTGLFEPEPIEKRQEPHNADWDRRIFTLHTPAGDLQATSLVSLRGLPGMQETHFLKTREDAEKYLSLPLPKLINDDISGFHAAVAAIGDRGVVDVRLGRSPAGHVASLWGSELFAMMTVMDRDIIRALCEHDAKREIHCVKHLLALGPGPFFNIAGEEFLAPPLHGPRDFADFVVHYEKPLFDLVHEADGRLHVHCHGSVKKIFPLMLELGVDVLHPIEPPPMGDLPAAEAKKMAAGRLTIEGNVQIAHMYEHTADQVRREVEQLIREAFADRKGLIVCPSASLYQRGKGAECCEQVKAMIDAVLGWRA